jgi:hypothetical protein
MKRARLVSEVHQAELALERLAGEVVKCMEKLKRLADALEEEHDTHIQPKSRSKL